MERGLIQIYTGNGKGKTTAAVGQGIRAAGRGMKVKMIQFLKSGDSGEVLCIGGNIKNFEIHGFKHSGKFIKSMGPDELIGLASETEQGMALAETIMREESCDILILDEFFVVIHNGLMTVEKAISLAASRPGSMELILTGRNAPREFIDMADLVTEMVCIRHPLNRGISARTGIER